MYIVSRLQTKPVIKEDELVEVYHDFEEALNAFDKYAESKSPPGTHYIFKLIDNTPGGQGLIAISHENHQNLEDLDQEPYE